MMALSVHGALFLCAFLQLFSLPGGQVPDCQEVRAVFQSLHPGSKWVPETPVSGNSSTYFYFLMEVYNNTSPDFTHKRSG